MAVRNDFAPGEVLQAQDVNDTFASKLPYSYGTATPSTTDSGFLWYDSNSTPAAPKFWDGSAFQALSGGGKILQVIRATDTTNRSTTSTTFVDATGMSVTITPTKSTSALLLVFSVVANTAGAGRGVLQITDTSNNPISGSEESVHRANAVVLEMRHNLVAYATPATTSSVTYKMRFKDTGASLFTLQNATNTGQMYAIEVSA